MVGFERRGKQDDRAEQREFASFFVAERNADTGDTVK